jgi:septum formation protein
MRGRTGTLWTGHCLVDTAAGRTLTRSVATDVHFADVTDAEIDAYCATGEPTQVAGAFTIDGLGGWFVERVGGDPHNVVGLSLPTLRAMLRELGHTLTDLGYPGS